MLNSVFRLITNFGTNAVSLRSLEEVLFMLTEASEEKREGLLLHGRVISDEAAWRLSPPPSTVDDGSRPYPEDERLTIIIERRRLIRECILNRLRKSSCSEVIAFSSVTEWAEVASVSGRPCTVLYSVADASLAESVPDLMQLLRLPEPPAVILLMTVDESSAELVDIVKSGIRGYIPTSVSVEVAVSVLHLVRAGGTFIPATCLELRPSANASCLPPDSVLREFNFTSRQELVIQSLCRGKSNKVIAYELDMRECTVKVHVRNIMRKLKARNRTEVAMLVTRPGSRPTMHAQACGRTAS